jgi:hypothetical protein
MLAITYLTTAFPENARQTYPACHARHFLNAFAHRFREIPLLLFICFPGQ